MSDCVKCNQSTIKFQSPLNRWSEVLEPLYQRFIPSSIRFRRNVKQAKLTDVAVLALLCWQVELGMTDQRRFYRFLTSLGFQSLPERSRFSRICARTNRFFQLIRCGLMRTTMPQPSYTIIDSFPMPLCQNIRNRRAKLFKPNADIGYNATKRMWYYGFKGSFEVTNQGVAVAYTITAASKHDIKMVPTLVDQYPCQHILGDVGYLSQKLHQQLAKIGVDFWTPKRRNMKQPKADQRLLKRQRRHIETVFSKWISCFDLEHNRARSLAGFQTRIEQCLFVDTWFRIN